MVSSGAYWRVAIGLYMVREVCICLNKAATLKNPTNANATLASCRRMTEQGLKNLMNANICFIYSRTMA